MTNAKLLGLVVVALVAQAVGEPDVRLGPTAAHLSDGDVRAIRGLQQASEEPWVFVGHSPGFIRDWFVDVYLEPQPKALSGRVRRGEMQTFVAPMPSGASYESHGAWRKEATARYAQVLREAGHLEAISGSRDLNRPFRLVGKLTDEELLALVDFIRSSPVALEPRAGSDEKVASRVRGGWPIISVIVAGTVVNVQLIDDEPRERSGQRVVCRREGASWVAQSVWFWIAD